MKLVNYDIICPSLKCEVGKTKLKMMWMRCCHIKNYPFRRVSGDSWGMRPECCGLTEKLNCLMMLIMVEWDDKSTHLLVPLSNLTIINPFTTVAISILLEVIGRFAYFLSWSIMTPLHSDINQTVGSGDTLSMWENRCMHATVCLLCAGQRRPRGEIWSVQRSILVGQIGPSGRDKG